MAARDLLEGDALALDDRKAHGRDQFIGAARGGEHVLLKRLGGDDALAALLRAQHHRTAEHRERQRQLRTRIGMGDGAADGAPVAGLEVTDERQRRGEQRQLLFELRPIHQRVLRHRGADLDHVAAVGDAAERRKPRNVDQHAGLDQPQIEHRNERLAAGENARVVAVFGEQFQHFVDRIGPDVFERTRLHRRGLIVSSLRDEAKQSRGGLH